MPLYEYKCVKCGHRFERIESFSASDVKKCPKCGGRAERMLAAPAIQFKGSGWYVTDYGGKNSDAASKETSGDGNSKAGKETTAGKPAEKSDAKDSSKAAKKSKEK